MKKNILNFLLTFALIFLLLNLFFKQEDPQKNSNQIILQPLKKEYGQGEIVQAELKNYTNNTVTLKNDCPHEPLNVLAYSNGKWTQKEQKAPIACADQKDIFLKPGEKHLIDYSSWNHALFHELGRYKLAAEVTSTENIGSSNSNEAGAEVTPSTSANPSKITLESSEFEIKPEGIFHMLWTRLFYQPIYNVLIFFIDVAPGKDLGLAIILLTILIRTILLIPSQNALKSQAKMQEIQPKLQKIREKYKENQEMIAKESMALWKEYKVNPLGSCLPLIIQFPILIALFYVVQSGLNPDNHYLLYGFLKHFTFEGIQTNFLGILELTKINLFVLPLIVGGLQFLQMKLALAKNPNNQKVNKKAAEPNEMEIASKMMVYVMPVMITIFTATVPAGVGLYWAVSTLYGIGQQLIVNRQREKSAKVKVIS